LLICTEDVAEVSTTSVQQCIFCEYIPMCGRTWLWTEFC